MKPIDVSPETVAGNLLSASRDVGLCLLDSCGANQPGSNLMIAGVYPVETFERTGNPDRTLGDLDRILTCDKPAIFSLSYDFGRRLQRITTVNTSESIEPDLFIS